MKQKIICIVCGCVLTKDNWAKSWAKHHKYQCRTCHKLYVRKLRKQNPNQRRNYELQSRYNITFEKYNQLLSGQNYKCAICERPASMFRKRLHVDHCHKAQIVRGLLCYGCNRFLGQIQDDKNVLIKAAKYVEGLL